MIGQGTEASCGSLGMPGGAGTLNYDPKPNRRRQAARLAIIDGDARCNRNGVVVSGPQQQPLWPAAASAAVVSTEPASRCEAAVIVVAEDTRHGREDVHGDQPGHLPGAIVQSDLAEESRGPAGSAVGCAAAGIRGLTLAMLTGGCGCCCCTMLSLGIGVRPARDRAHGLQVWQFCSCHLIKS